MVAFLPQFGFLHGAVSNDPLIILLSAAALWQLLQLWLGGLSRGKIVALGVTIGLAILAKMTGLLLLFFASGVLFLLTWRSSHWRHLMKTMALLILPVLLIAGWLLWRNWMLYGDVTAVNQFIELAGGDRGYGWRQILGDMDRVWLSFFAFFGWMNVQPPAWVYLAWNGLVALAGVGAVVGLVKYRQSLSFSRASATSTLLFQPWTPGALLGAWFLFLLAAWVRFMMRTPADQGRLLFPALVPLALALAYGLSQYRQVWIYWGASLLALATSLYCLAVVIPAAYTPPLTITEAEVPPTAVPFDVDMGQGLELVAVQLETKASRPGEWVWLTLYWRAYAVPPRGPVAVLELLGRQLTLVGKRHIYYDGGLYPASLWPAGGVIADRLGIRLDEQMTVPTQVRLFLHVVEGTEPVEAGNLKVVPARWPARESSVLARLGNGIELVTADLATTTTHPGAGLTVHIRWQVTAAPAGDLTTFVHLGEPTQPPLAQADGPPVNGDYPTRFWAAGEVITDSYTLVMPPDLPDGRYPVYLGLYDPNTGIRLPLVSRGVRQINDAYLAGWLTVEP
jgi:hypothetical protein